MALGLETHGQEVYDALVDGRDLNAAHKAIALNAARLADKLDELHAALEDAPLTVVNSQGTETANPLITESRMLTNTLSQILGKLGVSALPEKTSGEKTILDDLASRRAKRESNRPASAV